MQIVFLIFSVVLVIFIIYNLIKKKKPIPQPEADVQRKVLQQHVPFYQKLDALEKSEFERRINNFLGRVRIKGVDVKIDDRDKIFVAAAAIIPIFAFKTWEYRNIHDVLIYPATFNKSFKTNGPERDVLGMVGNGAMENLMILSLPELQNSFLDSDSKSSAAIHEFVHLVDKDDGTTDGCPNFLLAHKYAVPWLKRMHQEIALILTGKSDINPYGATNEAEFLAVAAEYFFKQPELMQTKHPELFAALQQIFATDAES